MTCDVDGASEIAYIADVTGIHTDGVGGDVIISGSDDDTTADRSYGIYADSKDYRTFVGFHVVGVDGYGMEFINCSDIIIRDCCIDGGDSTNVTGIYMASSYTNIEISRCLILATTSNAINIYHSSDVSASSFTVADCLVISSDGAGVICTSVDSVVVENCTILGCSYGIRTSSFAAEATMTVRNCIIAGCPTGMSAGAAGNIASSYCQNSANSDSNWSAGAGDVEDYIMNFQFPLLYGTYGGIRYPVPLLGELNPYAYAAHRTGSSETSTDLFGITKPTTAAISSWGAIQFQDRLRETTTTRGSSAASIKLATAGEHQIWVPVTAASTTISVYVYREANYAGTLPRMVIKEPGQTDRTTTDTGSASQWNQLSDTFTPTGDTDYVVVCLQSLNTATSGSYAIYFDDLAVA